MKPPTTAQASRARQLLKMRLEIGAVALLLLGATIATCWVVYTMYGDRMLSAESRGWPHVPGEIVSARVGRHHGGYRSGTTCNAELRYRYAVYGVPHVGHRVSFDGSGSCDEAAQVVDRHPPGQVVDVYYRPSDPETSVLEPDSWTGTGDLAIVLIAVVALIMCVPTVVLCAYAVLIIVRPDPPPRAAQRRRERQRQRR
jgi:hypothetical protein